MIPVILNSVKRGVIYSDRRQISNSLCRGEKQEEITKHHWQTSGSNEWVPCLDCADGFTDGEHMSKLIEMVHFKYVWFIVRQLYLDEAVKFLK